MRREGKSKGKKGKTQKNPKTCWRRNAAALMPRLQDGAWDEVSLQETKKPRQAATLEASY